MSKKIALLTAVFVALGVALISRNSVGTLRDRPLYHGLWQEFPEPAETTTRLARESLRTSGLNVVEEFRPASSTTVLFAESGMGAWTFGEVVRVVVTETGPSRSSVRVISEPKLKANSTARDHAPDVISEIAAQMGR
jgi:hypothetical protein